MKKITKLLMAAIALGALVGCGQSPAEAPLTRSVAAKKPAATAAKAATKAPSVSSTAKPATSKPATSKPSAPASPAAPVAEKPGSLKLSVKVTGNAPVAKLAMSVFEQADPSVQMEDTLTVANGVAGWEQKEVPAGRYTFQVKALDAEGTVLGSGSTEALVKAGSPTEVVLDLRANTLTPSSTESPAPSGGGTIGLVVEII